jgi:hypothetical protein
MTIEIARAVLVADSAVSALVGERISALMKAQGTAMPAITLQRVSVTPQNHLRGNGGLDYVRVQADCWATSYDGVRALAIACRSAMEAASHQMLSELDNYDPQVDPGLYRITQDFQVWV